MTEFRVYFTRHFGVNQEAQTKEEAINIVLNKKWEYGMEFETEPIEIDSAEEM